jgi:hypothetical protein
MGRFATLEKWGAKNRVIVIQKEKRQAILDPIF